MVRNRKPNRYFLIAKPSRITNINSLTFDDTLDTKQVIYIDIENKVGTLKKLTNQREIVKSKNIEKKIKHMLAEIDEFIFAHSSLNGALELRTFLKEAYGYDIPNDYDFGIVYRAKSYDANFRMLKPIYGTMQTIVLWLQELVKTEIEEREQPREISTQVLRESPAWQTVYQKFVIPDVTKNTSLIATFDDWADKRGNVGQIARRKASDNFQYSLEDLINQGRYEPGYLMNLASMTPLSVIMRAVSNYPVSMSGVWDILKYKLSNYKEMRGYLYRRYDYKRNVIQKEFETLLAKTPVLFDFKDPKFHLDIDFELMHQGVTYYDLLRYSDVSLAYLRHHHLLPAELESFDFEIQKEVEDMIKEKKFSDEKEIFGEPVYTNIIFRQDGVVVSKRVYLEHEEELLNPEDFTPIEEVEEREAIEEVVVKIKKR